VSTSFRGAMSMSDVQHGGHVPDDIDEILLDGIPLNDGVWALAGIDDDRAVHMWSSYHATRAVQQLAIARNRVKAAEWALADVQGRNLPACVATAGAALARARHELAEWEHKARLQEAARRQTWFAWKTPVIDS